VGIDHETYSCGPLGSVTSGSGSFTVTESAGCLADISLPADTATYTWNSPNGSSTISFPATTVARAADGTTTVISVGSVTSGLGAGQVATRTVVLPQLDPGACASSQGVTQEVGTATLLIAPV
jgi:hypothetical protein